MRLRTLLLTLALALGALVPVQTAQAAECTPVWLAAPSYNGVFDTKQSVCIDRTISGYKPVHDAEGNFVDWVLLHTTEPPNDGLVYDTARHIRALARLHGVNVQFAVHDQLGRLGCSGGFINGVSATYQPRTVVEHSGRGLIRIGTGTTSRCMHYKTTVANTFKYETAHALIERICGDVEPPLLEGHGDPTTAAYSLLYLGATMNEGGQRPDGKDVWRAKQVHAGRCA